jgi:multiple antibiotic resistance protein
MIAPVAIGVHDRLSRAETAPTVRRRAARMEWGGLILVASLAAAPAAAQSAGTLAVHYPEMSAKKIFLMLFLMLGPTKILVPFVAMTKGTDKVFRRQLATRSLVFSIAALALAGLLGRRMIENFEISVPVLALAGGVVLFLVALQTVLQQSAGASARGGEAAYTAAGLHLAFSPLAFPTIVTPYGIAAVIVFATLADQQGTRFAVAGIVLAIMAMNWLAMLFAEAILRSVGTALQIFAVVLGVTQIALGLQVILQSLILMGVFVERAA